MSKIYSQQYKSDSSIQEESPQFSFFHQDQFMSSETESQQLFEHFTQNLSNRQAVYNNLPYSTNNLEKTAIPESISQKSLCVYDMFHQYKEHDINSISTLFKRNSNKKKMTLKQLKIENEIKKKKQQCITENKQKELIYDGEEEYEEEEKEEIQQEEYQISTKRRKNISQQNKLRYNSTSPRVASFQSKLPRSVKQNLKSQNCKYLKQFQQQNCMLENQNISTSQDFSSQSNSEQNYQQQFDILKYEDYQERNNESSFNDSSSQQILAQKMVNVSFQQDTENQLMFNEEYPYNQSVIEQLDEESQNEMKLKEHQSKLNKNYKPIYKRIEESLQQKEQKIERIRQEIMQEKLIKQFLEVECNLTFHPQINQTDKQSRTIDEFYDEINNWQQKKMNGIYQNQLQKQLEEQSDATFTPSLNQISRTIVEEKQRDFDKIEDRLIYEGFNYQLAKQKLINKEQKDHCSFKPHIGLRSQKIAAKQKSIDLFSSQKKSNNSSNQLVQSLSSIEQNTNLQDNLEFKNCESLAKYNSFSQLQQSFEQSEDTNKLQNRKKAIPVKQNVKKQKENINISKKQQQQQQRNFLKQKEKSKV